MKSFKILVICGPTAVGKTSLSIEIAKRFKGEIISADSRQFFKELNIGTAKPTESERSKIPHHFINSHSITVDYTAGKFEKQALKVISEINFRKNIPIVVGGSGLYIQALTQGIDQPPSDPVLRQTLNKQLEEEGLEKLCDQLRSSDLARYNEIDLHNPRRVLRALEISIITKRGLSKPHRSAERAFEPVVIVLNRNREELYGRINLRVDQMMEQGLAQEVKTLLPFKEKQAMQTVGYRELMAHYDGDLSLEEAISLIKQNTRRYAKRQITWFKRLENATWFHPDETDKIMAFLEESFQTS